MEITKESLIGEVLLDYPEVQDIMLKHLGEEVACVFCPGQVFDTFEMIAELHGIEDDVIEDMLKEISTTISETKK
ncbi:MAG: DUF1858 domain-containing protein [bacterium]|nr:DUF1858 domain-containing protein [bacterium]